jgi:Putative zinc-finger
MSDFRTENTPEHAEIVALIPWYVNATLRDEDRLRLDAHLGLCAACREELSLERRVHAGITAEPGIEYMPAASLKRLQSRLDAEQSMITTMDATAPRSPRRRGAMPWQGLMAASIAVTALAVSLLAADRWMQYRAQGAAPNFYTVTDSLPRARDEAIRAVFAPTLTLVELQAMLDEAQLRIISGPSEAGVYSLAAQSPRPVSESLSLLRQHSTVRFAESTRPEKSR